MTFDQLDTLLSIVASVIAIFSVFYAKETRAQVAKLEQRINTTNLVGGQHVKGTGNTTVGGSYNAP